MEAKMRTLVCLLISIALLGGALWWVVSSEQKAEQAASAAAEGSILLSSFTADQLEQIEVLYQGQCLTLQYSDEGWTLLQDPAYHLDESACNTMRTALSALYAKRQITAEPDQDYSMDEPQVVVTATVAGQANTFVFGAENPVTGDLYLQKTGEDALYTVAYNKAACFQLTKEELFGSFDPTGLAAAGLQQVEYTLLDGAHIALTVFSEPVEQEGTEGYTTVWRLADEADAELDESKVQGILSALSSYVCGQITQADPADYGFDQPLVTVTACTDEKTVVLRYAVGADGCYLMVEGDSSIYQVDMETVNRFSYAEQQLKIQ